MQTELVSSTFRLSSNESFSLEARQAFNTIARLSAHCLDAPVALVEVVREASAETVGAHGILCSSTLSADLAWVTRTSAAVTSVPDTRRLPRASVCPALTALPDASAAYVARFENRRGAVAVLTDRLWELSDQQRERLQMLAQTAELVASIGTQNGELNERLRSAEHSLLATHQRLRTLLAVEGGTFDSSADLLTVTVLARKTGVRTTTLRAWERRYGIPQPSRDLHGHRVYATEDIERVTQMQAAINLGIRPSDAADAVRRGMAVSTERIAHARRAIFDAVSGGDLARGTRWLSALRQTLGSKVFLTDVCEPLVEMADRGHESGDVDLRVLFHSLLADELRLASLSATADVQHVVVEDVAPGASDLDRERRRLELAEQGAKAVFREVTSVDLRARAQGLAQTDRSGRPVR